ncbi:hypothetical protein ABZT17_11995 [Streptomyces sp. NPDC005648]|uniref:hypothetical protein n=1 Tax=Streptomyces sp. NPDC005648 TaxID=3157044 RepID=UPI0033ABA44D
MPRIRVLEAIAGADFSWAPGDVIEVSNDEAAAWADGHRAELANDQEDGAGAAPSEVHGVPVVVGEDGQALEVLAATVEDTDPPDDAEDDGRQWVRWSVAVRLPVRATAEDGAAPDSLADPADLENEDPAQEATAPKLFDPREHTNKEVLAYLDTVGEQEALRVLDIEATQGDPPRAGIVKNRDQILAAARARDAAEGGGQLGAEKAAEFSRGGGGETAPETRDW